MNSPDSQTTARGIGSRLRAAHQAAWHRWYALRLAALGADSVINPAARIEYPGNIRIGRNVGVRGLVTLRANTPSGPGITIGDGCSILESTVLTANGGSIVLGRRCWLAQFCLITGNGHVRIGDNVLIAAHVAINTVSHHAERCDIPIADQGLYCDPVVIEDDVWIGLRATILQGVTIGRGAIVGAGALVTADVPPWSVAVGAPARVSRRRDHAPATP